MTIAGIDLSATEFWGLPLPDRAAAFATLRAQPQPPFFAEPETPFAEPGPGYYALVRYADVVEASKRPEVFSSAKGATSIPDLPVEFNEYFGSMINMDDPRHARQRGLEWDGGERLNVLRRQAQAASLDLHRDRRELGEHVELLVPQQLYAEEQQPGGQPGHQVPEPQAPADYPAHRRALTSAPRRHPGRRAVPRRPR